MAKNVEIFLQNGKQYVKPYKVLKTRKLKQERIKVANAAFFQQSSITSERIDDNLGARVTRKGGFRWRMLVTVKGSIVH